MSDFERIAAIRKNLAGRARAESACRRHFSEQRFLEVTTPTRVAAPGTDVYIEPQPSADQWLITSPEFHMKRLLAGGMRRIFQFAQCHRREEVGPWHQPEFTMLEWYRAGAEYVEVLRDTEQLVVGLGSEFDLVEIDTRALKLGGQLRPQVPDRVRLGDFKQVTVREAFQECAGVRDAADLAAEDEQQYFQLLVDKVEPQLASYPHPVFLLDYPVTQAALARPRPEEPSVAERFELYLAGVELCNGYGELVDPTAQRARFEADQRCRAERGLSQLPMDEALLAALERMPPSAGNALGFERLLALLLGCPLRDVMTFPT